MDELKIERDARVLVGGREVGRVTHVIVDPQTKEITQVVVAHDDRESTIPIAAVAAAGGGTVRLHDGASTALRGNFVRDAFHGIDDRTADADNAGVAAHGGAPLRDAEADAVIVERPTESTMQVTQMDQRASATEGSLRVPLVEERLTVGKRETELGEIAIRTTVTEEERTVPVTLRHEKVRVEERAVAERPATGADLFTEETLRVALRGEEAVVAKEAVVTGEVVVEKETVAREEQVSGTVRKQRVEVERDMRVKAPATDAPHADVRTALREGMPVLGADDGHIGTVKAVRANDFLVGGRLQRDVYIPFAAIGAVTAGRIGLTIPAAAVDEQGWPHP